MKYKQKLPIYLASQSSTRSTTTALFHIISKIKWRIPTESFHETLSSRIQSEWSLQEIVGSPESVERAGPVGIEPGPRLAFATPMQETDRPRVQIPAEASEIVTAQPVLVPPVVHRSYVPSEHQQKRRQRPQLVDSHSLLQLHPFLNLGRVVSGAPTVEIDHHHAGVEIARPPISERERERRVGPEGEREIGSEVGVAVLGSRENRGGAERSGGEIGNVVDEDEVGVEVNDASHAEREEVRQIAASVVKRAVQGGTDGGGDEAGDRGIVEGVDLEFQVRERRGDCGA